MTGDVAISCPGCRSRERCECGHARGVHGWTCAGDPYVNVACPCRRFVRATVRVPEAGER